MVINIIRIISIFTSNLWILLWFTIIWKFIHVIVTCGYSLFIFIRLFQDLLLCISFTELSLLCIVMYFNLICIEHGHNWILILFFWLLLLHIHWLNSLNCLLRQRTLHLEIWSIEDWSTFFIALFNFLHFNLLFFYNLHPILKSLLAQVVNLNLLWGCTLYRLLHLQVLVRCSCIAVAIFLLTSVLLGSSARIVSIMLSLFRITNILDNGDYLFLLARYHINFLVFCLLFLLFD